MRAASFNEVTHVMEHASTSFQSLSPSLIAKVPNIVVPDIRDCKATALEISQFSDLYVKERRKAAGKILGENAYSESTAAMIVVPVAKVFAFTCQEKGQSFVVLSLGFLELLRFEAAIAILQSCFYKTVGQVRSTLKSEKGKAKLQSTIKTSEEVFRFLQASAVLYFVHPEYLPRIEEHLNESLRRMVTVVLEPCLIFVILHEVGHIYFRTQKEIGRSKTDFRLEFLVEEEINSSKSEELFADEFALKSVPEEFQLPLIHGALLFFNVHNYYEALTGVHSGSHPFSLNRIHALYKKASHGQPVEGSSNLAIQSALKKGKNFWSTLGALESFSIEEKIDYLKTYVEKSKDNLNFELFTDLVNRAYNEIDDSDGSQNKKDL